MATLYTKTKLYLEANSKTWEDKKVSLQNNSDGSEDFISSWDYDIAEPTDAQLANYESAGNAQELLKANIGKRIYPSIGDQLDMQYKDLLNGTTTWKDAVAKVKKDNPKD